MTAVFARQAASAQRAITAKGEACMLVTEAEASDNTKPWVEVADNVPLEQPCRVLWLESNRQYQELSRALGDTEVVSGMQTGLMSNTPGVVPTVGARIRKGDGSMLTIDAADPLSPNGEVILYTLRFKK